MRENKEQLNTYTQPAYLAELLRPTPSGVAKLIAAWEGLSFEVKIQVITEIPKLQFPQYLHEKVLTKALQSENPYIRYLAARQFCFSREESDEGKAIRKRIEEDSDDLVRYSLLEENGLISGIFHKELNDPEVFFKLPQGVRLAKVRCLGGYGEEMVNLISYAVDHQLKIGTVSEIDLFEILSDYLNSREFAAHYKSDELSYDGFGQYLKGKDIVALWHLVLKVPESVSYVLIANLPEHAGLKSNIPEDLINGLNEGQLAELLHRKDIILKDLRKKVFFKSDEKEDLNEDSKFEHDFLRNAAIAYNFDLTYQEFAEVLAKPVKNRVQELIDLTNAHDLSLCLYEAIRDSLFNIDSDEVPPTSWEYAEFAKCSFDRKLLELQGNEREKEIRELRLYRLAQNAVPWKKFEKGYPPSGKLKFLAKSVVEGDTWATFMAYSAAWEKQRATELEIYLPSIYEIYEVKTDETELNEHHKSDYTKTLTKGDFILYNTQKWVDIWLSVCSVTVLIGIYLLGYGVYKLFVGEYSSALKSGFVVVIGLVLFKGALGQYTQLREEQKRIIDEMLK